MNRLRGRASLDWLVENIALSADCASLMQAQAAALSEHPRVG